MEALKKWVWIMMFLLFLSLLSYLLASFFSLTIGESYGAGNVALIPIEGVIMFGEDSSYLSTQVANAKQIIDFIQKANANPEIKAILLDINSPGGGAVASMEVANAVKRTNKTVYAFIHEQGTSGAYWIASAAHKIISNELALTGSIGVISSYLEFSGLLQDYNVTYQRLVAGKYKDIGTPYRRLTTEEESILQKRLDAIHDRFIIAVSENRHIPKEKVKEIATGLFYLGSEAKELGLVDVVGDMEQVTEMIKQDIKATEVQYVEYKHKRTVFDMLEKLSSSFGFWIGKGMTAPQLSTVQFSA